MREVTESGWRHIKKLVLIHHTKLNTLTVGMLGLITDKELI